MAITLLPKKVRFSGGHISTIVGRLWVRPDAILYRFGGHGCTGKVSCLAFNKSSGFGL